MEHSIQAKAQSPNEQLTTITIRASMQNEEETPNQRRAKQARAARTATPQRLFYARAKWYQSLFTVLALLLPIVGVLFAASLPEIRPFLGLGSIFVLLFDVGIISLKQKEDCKRGAKIQEQFDTEVLKLNWNQLVAGKCVDAEEIRAIATGPISECDHKLLVNWYEPAISRLPLEFGRLICQRTNLVYDMRVRKQYAEILTGAAGLLFASVALLGLWQGLTWGDLILTMGVPFLPLAAYVFREYRKQYDTIETLTILKSEQEKMWDKALTGTSNEELTFMSRALQDAIYRHRASNPLVFDWLYSRLRAREEGLTRYAVDKLVSHAEQTLKLAEVQRT